mmetsp:Transcript_29234/g.53357  ORF Transcript_29234/g.53357 Transcript_29234/m.53357 type:complete len:109 (+) Transcript_29234:77-403(+)
MAVSSPPMSPHLPPQQLAPRSEQLLTRTGQLTGTTLSQGMRYAQTIQDITEHNGHMAAHIKQQDELIRKLYEEQEELQQRLRESESSRRWWFWPVPCCSTRRSGQMQY